MKNILDKINRADEIQANLELDKTELGKHEVELALVDDVKKYTEELNKLFPEASNIEDKLDKIVKELFPLLNKADALVKKIKDIQDKSDSAQIKFVAAIKELGFNPSESKENMALYNIKDSIETRRERIVNILQSFK